MFEAYFHKQFSTGKENLTYKSTKNKSNTFTCTSLVECTSTELNNPSPGIHDVASRLFVPISRNNPTWDSYCICGGMLLFLQLTVSFNHSAGDWENMCTIANCVEKKNKKIEIVLLYVVPKNSKFGPAPGLSGTVPTTKYGAKIKRCLHNAISVAIVKT